MKRRSLASFLGNRFGDSWLNSCWNSNPWWHQVWQCYSLKLSPPPAPALKSLRFVGFFWWLQENTRARSLQRWGAFKCKLRYFCLGEKRKKEIKIIFKSTSLIHFLQFGEISGNYFFFRNEPLANFHLEWGKEGKKK